MPTSAPLIVTVKLDKQAQEYFAALRQKHFPAHCNYMEAHLTFFHKLPANLDVMDATLKKFAEHGTMDLEVTGIRNIGNGNVFTLASVELGHLHKAMQQSLGKYLITQDRKKLWPHITVQNKVTAFKAKQTTELLLDNFKPFTIKAIGLTSWLYLKGPWQHQKDYLFNNSLA